MLNLGYDRAASFASPITTQTSVSTTPLNIAHGLIAGDQIVLTGDVSNTDTLATATNLAGVAGEAVFATGTFNAASDTFTYSTTGHDALLTFDGQYGSNDYISVVLVGAAHEIAGSSLSAGTLTLG